VAIREHKLPNKMIETGAQIVNRIPNNETQTERLRLTNIKCDAFLASIRIELSDRSIRFTVKKDSNFVFEVEDVLFGPFDLGLDKFESVRSHSSMKKDNGNAPQTQTTLAPKEKDRIEIPIPKRSAFARVVKKSAQPLGPRGSKKKSPK
jgi:hypothetical protein